MTQATELEANKSLAQKFLAALGRGDVAGVQEVIAEDIDAICTGTGVMAGSRNYAAVCDAVKMLAKTTKNGLDFRIISIIAEADRVACEVEGKSTLVDGRSYNNQYFFLFTIRDEKIVGMKEYMDSLLVERAFGSLAA
ncbi:nuclear transport factor 2 family protein [Noviherbaspirillum sedimenti]|uniref:SnoaL-like domain-containing protein n=1 Tax=Noviherbaspirillum sedimenti TaxID=2320865 RepID=A0A3A3G9G1_9BURK|nr:nuclear transport factor 2 family protein [Noviherbaspirillum sedimenti]RJG03212.1 hypothetical protein D3878_17775 [Noviherbaspirillum sedimenti]